MHTLPHHTDIGYVHRTPSADGILGEINTESALRAAVEIETGLPPAEFYENTATMHTYIHMKSDVPTTSRTTEGRQRNRGAQERAHRRASRGDDDAVRRTTASDGITDE